jgi:hypothetical protein
MIDTTCRSSSSVSFSSIKAPDAGGRELDSTVYHQRGGFIQVFLNVAFDLLATDSCLSLGTRPPCSARPDWPVNRRPAARPAPRRGFDA